MSPELRKALEGTPPMTRESLLQQASTKGSSMSIPAAAQTLLIDAIQSPTAQSALLSTISAGETPLESIIDSAISNLKASGMIGLVITAAKGTIEAEVNAAFSKMPPASIAAFLTAAAVAEVKRL